MKHIKLLHPYNFLLLRNRNVRECRLRMSVFKNTVFFPRDSNKEHSISRSIENVFGAILKAELE